VGEPYDRLNLAAINRAFAPAAVLLELAPSAVATNARQHWKREYRDVAETAVAEEWPFLADALATDSGEEGGEYAVRFRPYADFREALGSKDAFMSAHRRVRNFLSATTELTYRRKCDAHFYPVFNRVAETFPLPDNGLTVLTFTAPGGHNLEDNSNSRGGFFIFVKNRSARHRAIVLQFSGKRSTDGTSVHEIGHALFLKHAPGHAPGTREAHGTDSEGHDKDSDCAMAYTFKPDFCGLCLLKLAGYHYEWIRNDGTIKRPDEVEVET